jgi:hypothetical protein
VAKKRPLARTLPIASLARPAAAPRAPATSRRVSIYFPVDVARRLKVHCAQTDEDMSSFVSRVVTQALPCRR